MPWKSETKESCGGSAQVVEFSVVFPVAALTVVALLYLTFALFFYAWSCHLCFETVERTAQAVGGERVYWQLTGHPVDPDTLEYRQKELASRTERMEVLPGIRFSTDLSEKGNRLTAIVRCTYFKKTLFNVRAVRTVRKPTEFAQNADLFSDVLDDTGFTKQLTDRFGRYLAKDTTYEIF